MKQRNSDTVQVILYKDKKPAFLYCVLAKTGEKLNAIIELQEKTPTRVVMRTYNYDWKTRTGKTLSEIAFEQTAQEITAQQQFIAGQNGGRLVANGEQPSDDVGKRMQEIFNDRVRQDNNSRGARIAALADDDDINPYEGIQQQISESVESFQNKIISIGKVALTGGVLYWAINNPDTAIKIVGGAARLIVGVGSAVGAALPYVAIGVLAALAFNEFKETVKAIVQWGKLYYQDYRLRHSTQELPTSSDELANYQTINTDNILLNQPTACNILARSGGTGVTKISYNVGMNPGVVTISYEMYTVPDKMEVYYNSATPVASTGGFVSGSGTVSFKYIRTRDTDPTEIYIVMTGNSQSSTQWDITARCPQ
ncbi:hypothetical protein [Spirosoma panaciterrae]|uniref:hypothetical protein n=1 Tax=Spirosoma panaciterrae TaxID=496058 RepID=UPI0012FB1ACC|nr:hypothetical protein [Spirosoma panaciterrae]